MTIDEAKKLKVGDKVLIRNGVYCITDARRISDWSDTEKDCQGKVVTIKSIEDSLDYPGESYFNIEEKDVAVFYAHMFEEKFESCISQEVFNSLKPGDKIRIVDELPGWTVIAESKRDWCGKVLTVDEYGDVSFFWGKAVKAKEDNHYYLWFRECIAEKVEEKKPRFVFFDESGEEHEFKGFSSLNEVTVDLTPDDPKNGWFVTSIKKPNDIILHYTHSGKVLATRDADGKWNITDEGVRRAQKAIADFECRLGRCNGKTTLSEHLYEMVVNAKKATEAVKKANDSIDALAHALNIRSYGCPIVASTDRVVCVKKDDEPECPFKVGDRVQFKTWEEMADEYGPNIAYCTIFVPEMKHLCGTYATISDIKTHRAGDRDIGVKLKDFSSDGDTCWFYTTAMLKPARVEIRSGLRPWGSFYGSDWIRFFDWGVGVEGKKKNPAKTERKNIPECPFQVGDRVRFKSWGDLCKVGQLNCRQVNSYIKFPGYYFFDSMRPLCGTYATIEGIQKEWSFIYSKYYYRLKLKNYTCKIKDELHYRAITADMVEHIPDPNEDCCTADLNYSLWDLICGKNTNHGSTDKNYLFKFDDKSVWKKVKKAYKNNK